VGLVHAHKLILNILQNCAMLSERENVKSALLLHFAVFLLIMGQTLEVHCDLTLGGCSELAEHLVCRLNNPLKVLRATFLSKQEILVFLSENPVKKLQDLSHEQNVVLFALL
jgi:hypothetical protein